jgi:hypothetical protein
MDNLGEWNPQLFRELKGRLKPRNVAIIAALSVVGQVLLYLYFKTLLPINEGVAKRYCVGNPPASWHGYQEPTSYIPNNYCIKDLLGNFLLIKELWWLDIFITMSIMGIFALLVVGTYMLIADLSREEGRSTLNFIRLSPQSATNIFVGKILGVPILVYLFGLIAVPWHFFAGLAANIPAHFIFAFYLVLAVSCVFFYSAAILYSLVSSGLGSFQAWLGSAAVFFFLLTMMPTSLEVHSSFSETSCDWLILFYPGTALFYLVKSTFLAPDTIGYLDYDALKNLSWYGQSLWKNAATGLGFMLVNYGLWSFWMWQGLKRRFHNPLTTVISKTNSYWLSGCFIAFNLGFALQHTDDYYLHEGFQVLQLFNLILFLLLIAALSPHRQTLQDWARYHHKNPQANRTLLKDLIIGEKSPSILAIAFNIALVSIYTIPSLFLLPLSEYRMPVLMGLIVSGTIALIYATVVQLMVMLKTSKRGLIASGSVVALMVLPITIFAFFQIDPSDLPSVWLFSALPSLATEYLSLSTLCWAFLGQIAAIAVLNFQMTRLLRQAGMSETKALLSEAK